MKSKYKYETVKAHVKVAFSAIVILTAALLVLLQWGNSSRFSLYGKNIEMNTAALMVVSAGCGMGAVRLFGMLFRGMRAITKNRRSE